MRKAYAWAIQPLRVPRLSFYLLCGLVRSLEHLFAAP